MMSCFLRYGDLIMETASPSPPSLLKQEDPWKDRAKDAVCLAVAGATVCAVVYGLHKWNFGRRFAQELKEMTANRDHWHGVAEKIEALPIDAKYEMNHLTFHPNVADMLSPIPTEQDLNFYKMLLDPSVPNSVYKKLFFDPKAERLAETVSNGFHGRAEQEYENAMAILRHQYQNGAATASAHALMYMTGLGSAMLSIGRLAGMEDVDWLQQADTPRTRIMNFQPEGMLSEAGIKKSKGQ